MRTSMRPKFLDENIHAEIALALNICRRVIRSMYVMYVLIVRERERERESIAL